MYIRIGVRIHAYESLAGHTTGGLTCPGHTAPGLTCPGHTAPGPGLTYANFNVFACLRVLAHNSGEGQVLLVQGKHTCVSSSPTIAR
jgi:hypothetical protein